MTTAFVLSGAGNRGPLEVGALRALLDHGIKPDLIIGTSAGAINSVYLAAHGVADPKVTDRMTEVWLQATTGVVYPGNLATVAWRFITKSESLFSSDGMRGLIQKALPPGVTKYGDLRIPLYTTATDLLTSRLFLFGEDPSASLVIGVLASASVPVIHPPVAYNGLQLVDGGTVANVPASVAMDKGAGEIYVINASRGEGKVKPADGVLEVLGHTLSTMLAQGFLMDIDRADADPNVNLHHIHVQAFDDISFRDFSKTREMVKIGQEKAEAYLAAPAPHLVMPPGLPQGETVGAAHEIIPPFKR